MSKKRSRSKQIDGQAAINLDREPEISSIPEAEVQAELRDAYSLDSAPSSRSIAEPERHESRKIGTLSRWEKLSLVVLFTALTGFSAGAGLAFMILNGTFDIKREQVRSFMSDIRAGSANQK